MTDASLWQVPLTYDAVAATKAVDLIRHPPVGFRPLERAALIGHGSDRFEFASLQAMTWGIQKRSGFRIRTVEFIESAPAGVDAAAAAFAPAVAASRQGVLASDGAALLAEGDTVVLEIPFGPFRVSAPARVVYIVDEPRRRGFAYGTLPGHPEDGEEAFIVELRDDNSVWIVIRAFSRPSRFWFAVWPVLRLTQEFYTRRYLAVLAAPIE